MILSTLATRVRVASVLNRRMKCLKERCLPHNMPQSNLSEGEDEAEFIKGAATVDDLRRNLAQKLVSLLKRLISKTYLSTTILLDVDLQPHIAKIQDPDLSEAEKYWLSHCSYSLFVQKCKNALASLQKIHDPSDSVERDKNRRKYLGKSCAEFD